MSEPDGGSSGAPPPGSVRLREVPEGVVLEVSGPLDLALAPQLRHAISRAERLRPRTLVIDLTGATFLASAGMTELVRAHRSADGVTVVRIVASGRLLMRPLEITRLTDELDIRSTLDAALAAV